MWQSYFEPINLTSCAEHRTESLKLFPHIIIRYMFKEFLCKISGQHLEEYHSYHRKTWRQSLVFHPVNSTFTEYFWINQKISLIHYMHIAHRIYPIFHLKLLWSFNQKIMVPVSFWPRAPLKGPKISFVVVVVGVGVETWAKNVTKRTKIFRQWKSCRVKLSMTLFDLFWYCIAFYGFYGLLWSFMAFNSLLWPFMVF